MAAYMRQRSRSPRRVAASAADGDGTRLYVGNLPFTVGDTELRNHFAQVRRPIMAEIPCHAPCDLLPTTESLTIPSRCGCRVRSKRCSRGGELTAPARAAVWQGRGGASHHGQGRTRWASLASYSHPLFSCKDRHGGRWHDTLLVTNPPFHAPLASWVRTGWIVDGCGDA